METSPAAYYQSNIDRYSAALSKLQRKIATIAFFRLLSFAAALITGYLAFRDLEIQVTIPLTFAFLVKFFYLVLLAGDLGKEKRLLEKLLFINNNEIEVLRNLPNQFPDGQPFQSAQGFSADLDIFGEGSVFQLLNRTTTRHGTQKLAALLKQPHLAKKTIEENQVAIRVLSPQSDERQLLTARGLLYGEKEGTLDDLAGWLETPAKIQDMWGMNFVRLMLPAFNIAALLYVFDTNNYNPLLTGIGISWFIIGTNYKYIKKQHDLLSKKQAILDQYAAILHVAATIKTGNSTLLAHLKTDSKKAAEATKRLSVLSRFFDQRSNLLVNIFINSLGMYDIQCMWALEGWKKKHKKDFNTWVQCVGNIELINSLATFAFNNPEYTYPSVKEGAPVIITQSLAHPLIPAKENVANDFELGEEYKLVLVTGSNMSGKTTFLRTLGVNLLLAQCGVPVCAKEFSFTPMLIQTSIRVSDSLQEHTSYFMAELKRLQQIIHQLQQSNTPCLVLIDEILRGTNSDDKTHGSDQFIRKLLQYNCLTLFASHDLALSKLEIEFPVKISNYCFESTIEKGELFFDYTLRPGVAKNKNASFLMKKMEII